MRVFGLAIAVLLLAGCGNTPTASVTDPAPVSQTDAAIAAAQGTLRVNPDSGPGLEALAAAYLQKVREVGDPSYYAKAHTLLQQALALNAGDADATTLMGTLELALHQFSAALEWGRRARKLDSYSANALGVIGDAQVELGRYPDAAATFQAMVDLRPDLSSYARVSYLRELYGDVPGAIDAMLMAVQAGGPVPENTAYTEVLLGNLYFNSGRRSDASQAYHSALDSDPGYVNALAGLAQVEAAQDSFELAARIYGQAIDVYPAPQFVIALGDVYAAAGRATDAQHTYDLAAAEQRLYEAAGVDLDLELALYSADHHRDLPDALAAAKRAIRDRPSIYSYDAYAWTLYASGDPAGALAASKTSRRLGTRDASLFFHAGMIEAALGMRAAAEQDLGTALAINPYFSVLHAPEARAELARLEAGR